MPRKPKVIPSTVHIHYHYLDGSQGAAGPVKIFTEEGRRAVEADLIRRCILDKPDTAKG